MRIASDYITKLEPGEVFVFGSNLSGKHSKGAAKTAMKWGAVMGQGVGLQGRTYGIPTKAHSVRVVLTIEKIKVFVDEFILFAKKYPNTKFLVTEIGCGLAGYKPKQIAPLFAEAVDMENIYLPRTFWNKIN